MHACFDENPGWNDVKNMMCGCPAQINRSFSVLLRPIPCIHHKKKDTFILQSHPFVPLLWRVVPEASPPLPNRLKRSMAFQRSESKLAVQYAGLSTYLDVELGMLHFQYSVSQRLWMWTSTPVSAAITVLGCIVAASESASTSSGRSSSGDGSDNENPSNQMMASFTSHRLRQGASLALAILSALFTVVRPYRQLAHAHKALTEVRRLGGRYNRAVSRASVSVQETMEELQTIQRDLLEVRTHFTGPFMSCGVACANVYLSLFTQQALWTRWRLGQGSQGDLEMALPASSNTPGV